MIAGDEESRVVPRPAGPTAADREDEKAQLQRRLDEARQSISETVGDIKETVEGQFATAKETITGILDWRAGFQQDPIVWSVGSLSAGFALGYTLGYAKRKGALGAKHSGLSAFADTLLRELAGLRHRLPTAALDPTFKRVLGFELSELLDEMGTAKPRRAKKRTTRTQPTAIGHRKSRTSRPSRTARSRSPARKKRVDRNL
jgi:hypothetical protein